MSDQAMAFDVSLFLTSPTNASLLYQNRWSGLIPMDRPVFQNDQEKRIPDQYNLPRLSSYSGWDTPKLPDEYNPPRPSSAHAGGDTSKPLLQAQQTRARKSIFTEIDVDSITIGTNLPPPHPEQIPFLRPSTTQTSTTRRTRSHEHLKSPPPRPPPATPALPTINLKEPRPYIKIPLHVPSIFEDFVRPIPHALHPVTNNHPHKDQHQRIRSPSSPPPTSTAAATTTATEHDDSTLWSRLPRLLPGSQPQHRRRKSGDHSFQPGPVHAHTRPQSSPSSSSPSSSSSVQQQQQAFERAVADDPRHARPAASSIPSPPSPPPPIFVDSASEPALARTHVRDADADTGEEGEEETGTGKIGLKSGGRLLVRGLKMGVAAGRRERSRSEVRGAWGDVEAEGGRRRVSR